MLDGVPRMRRLTPEVRPMTATVGRIDLSGTVALVRAAHIGPAVAVTTITALLAVATGLDARRMVPLGAAVFAGQLVIGWSNDLRDAGRDAAVRRQDKPLATGELTTHAVSIALAVGVATTLGLSAVLGWRSALVHVVVVVGSGIAYNLGVKATAWSWLPYAVAFGSLPAVVSLTAARPDLPAAWLVAASAALGTAAHFLNALPDLADDRATGVEGLPHRIGGRRSRFVAIALLLAASVATVLGPPGPPVVWAWVGLAIIAMAAVGALAGRGRTPFRCAIAIAVVDVVLLVLTTQA